MYTIDITMTATRRSAIFIKTMDSHFKNLFDQYLSCGHKLNLILNIDPIGPDKTSSRIQTYLDNSRDKLEKIRIRYSTKPSFPKAFKYVWSNIGLETDYVFHLEDDWELLRKVNLIKLIDILKSEGGLAILRLAAFTAGPVTMKNWNVFFPWNGQYYRCPEEIKTSVGFCGHPSLIKTEFVRNAVNYIDESRNPEKQFHSRGYTEIMKEVRRWRYGVYSEPYSPPLIRDLGRKWMVENNFRKSGCKAHFTNWEKGK